MIAHPTTWCGYVRRAHRDGHLTRHYRDVLLELHGYRGPGGIAWPAHETLADRAECCVRTVQRALEVARELGLVSWTARRLRAGWRSLRHSNAYPLPRPPEPLSGACGLAGALSAAAPPTGYSARRSRWRPFPGGGGPMCGWRARAVCGPFWR